MSETKIHGALRSINVLTHVISYMELTHLGSKAFKYQYQSFFIDSLPSIINFYDVFFYFLFLLILCQVFF